MARHGHDLGFSDIPNTRSSHLRNTPKAGAIGIVAAFCLLAIVFSLPPFLVLSALFMGALGLFSDRRDRSPWLRLSAQVVAAVIFVGGGKGGGFGPNAHPPLWMASLAILFLVGTANFYNFMDGINGIAALTAITAFGLLAGVSMIRPLDVPFPYPFVLLGIVCACCGFLPFNFPSAKVFMGDVGSLFLGFLFGAMALQGSSNMLEWICYGSFLSPFYADEISTLAVRLKSREKLWIAHRRHLYQVLANEAGLAHWKVATAYVLVQAAIGLGVMAMINRSLAAAAGLAVAGTAAVLTASILIRLNLSRLFRAGTLKKGQSS
jgi:Fuc2NAc and GlcNAc transferase